MSDLNQIIESQRNEQKEAAQGALDEYLENLNEIDNAKADVLVGKLKDEKYNNNFQNSLMQMSLLISAAMVINAASENEYSKIQKKVLFDSRQDDQDVKDMRLFYAQTITTEELSQVLNSEEEKNIYNKRLGSFITAYKELHQIA